MMTRWLRPILCLGFAFLFFFLCIGYASLNDELSITGTIFFSGVPGKEKSYTMVSTPPTESVLESFLELDANGMPIFDASGYPVTKDPAMQEESNSYYDMIKMGLAEEGITPDTPDYDTLVFEYYVFILEFLLGSSDIISSCSPQIFTLGRLNKYEEDIKALTDLQALALDDTGGGGIMFYYGTDANGMNRAYIVVDSNYERITLTSIDIIASLMGSSSVQEIYIDDVLANPGIFDYIPLYLYDGDSNTVLRIADLRGLTDTTNITDISNLFCRFRELTYVALPENFAVNCTSMSNMFYYCGSLTTLVLPENFGANCTDMSYMFSYCQQLTKLDLSKFDTSSCTTMEGMFDHCGFSALDLRSLDMSNVTSTVSMLEGNFELTEVNISGWDLTSLTDCQSMFKNCDVLTTIYASEDVDFSSVATSDEMFISCDQLVGQDGTACDGINNVDNIYARIDDRPDYPGYFSFEGAYEIQKRAKIDSSGLKNMTVDFAEYNEADTLRLNVTADKGYLMPESFKLKIVEEEYTIYTQSASNPEGIEYDSSTGILSIHISLLPQEGDYTLYFTGKAILRPVNVIYEVTNAVAKNASYTDYEDGIVLDLIPHNGYVLPYKITLYFGTGGYSIYIDGKDHGNILDYSFSPASEDKPAQILIPVTDVTHFENITDITVKFDAVPVLGKIELSTSVTGMSIEITEQTLSYVEMKIELEDGYVLPDKLAFVYYASSNNSNNIFLENDINTNGVGNDVGVVFNPKDNTLRLYANVFKVPNGTIHLSGDAVKADAKRKMSAPQAPEVATIQNVSLIETLNGMRVEFGSVTKQSAQLVLQAEDGFALPESITLEVDGTGIIHTVYLTAADSHLNPAGVTYNSANNTLTLQASFINRSNSTIYITGFATVDFSN